MTDLPIACTLTPEERAERDDLLIGLVRQSCERQVTDGGFRFVFPPSPAFVLSLAQAINAERACCRFLTFDVRFEPDNGPIILSVTGPPGTDAFLEGLLAETT
jgi:hypothetical protein